MKSVRPYSVLAGGYDFVMRHVDYAGWAAYIHGLVQRYRPGACRVLERGCGTGSFGLELSRLGPYDYTGTDLSPEMVACARLRAGELDSQLAFEVGDFRRPAVGGPYDVVLLLYDGINYCLDRQDVQAALESSAQCLAPDGLFLLDQSTPANSADNEAFFEDVGTSGIFAYRRSSAYDADLGLHRTTFEMAVDGQSYLEQHVQRAYSVGAMRRQLDEAGLIVEQCLDGFGDQPATEDSHRVQWVLRPAGTHRTGN